MPHLYRVARLFPDVERYRAFCALYASMRWVDDRVDGRRTDLEGLASWDREIARARQGSSTDTDFGPALADTFARFDLPLDPWQKLSRSMRLDLSTPGFTTYVDFRRYAEGATVSPASLFAALLLMRFEQERYRTARPFAEVRSAVRGAAVACYEIHILRDAATDIREDRVYFPRDELKAFKLEQRSSVDASWRPYLKSYALRIRGAWAPALAALETLEGPMSPRERLMLHLLVAVYEFSLAKIIRLNFDVWSDRHWPDPSEIAMLLQSAASRYEPGVDLSSLITRVVEDV
jgi:phytoene/squalene synthetase